MTSRTLKMMLMAGAGWTFLTAAPAMGATCEEQLKEVRAELAYADLTGAERSDYRALLRAAATLREQGDDQLCVEVLAEAREMVGKRSAGPAGAGADARSVATEGDGAAKKEGRARLSDATPLSQTTRLERIKDLDVVNGRGENLGSIVDVVVSFEDGKVRYGLLSMSGGLSSEEKLYPVPIEALKIADAPAAESRARVAGDGAADEQWGGGRTDDAGSQAMPAAGQDQQREETAQEAAQTERYAVDSQKTVGDLIGQEVENAQGETVGEIEAVIMPADKAQAQIVLSVGGLLGIGDKSVALPFERLTWQDDGTARLASDVTEEELEQLPSVEVTDDERLPEDTVIAEVVRMGPEPTRTATDESRDEPKQIGAGTGQARKQAGEQAGEQASDPSAQMAGSATEDRERPEDPLANKVLVLDIERQMLEQAPGFADGAFPNMADEKWHDTVLAFYQDVLGLGSGSAQQSPSGAEAKPETGQSSGSSN